MIRAVLQNGKVEPIDELPRHWLDGQELIVDCGELTDDPSEIKNWYDKLVALSGQISDDDHERMAAAIAEQARQDKDLVRRSMGLD